MVEKERPNDKVKFRVKVGKRGNSLAVTLPKHLIEYLEIEQGDKIEMQPENGKYGKYISVWKKKDVIKNNDQNEK